MKHSPLRLLLVAAALCSAPMALVAQTFAVSLVDGTLVEGRIQQVKPMEGGPQLILDIAGESRALPFSRILGIHGRPPLPGREPAQAIAMLVGGDRIEGEITGGDELGESVTLISRSLGQVVVALDRLQAIQFTRKGPPVPESDLVVPAGVESAEAIFRTASRGLDVLPGSIHRFTRSGVVFQWSQAAVERTYAFEDLVGIALRGGLPRTDRPDAQLVTRAGDVVGVEWRGADQEAAVFRHEGAVEWRVPWSDVAAIALLGPTRRYLSDLEPVRVEEGEMLDGQSLPPLYSYRRDRAATGVQLSAAGRCHAKGLGVHVRSVLTYRVPEGCHKLLTFVAISDEPLPGEVRGDADVRIRVDQQVLFESKGLRGGRPITRPGLLEVKPGQLLTLEAAAGRGLFIGDRVHWLSAVFLP